MSTDKRDWMEEAKLAATMYNNICEMAVVQARVVTEAALAKGVNTPEAVGKEVDDFLRTMAGLNMCGIRMIAALAGLRMQLDEITKDEVDSAKPIPDDVKGLADEFLSKFKKDLH